MYNIAINRLLSTVQHVCSIIQEPLFLIMIGQSCLRTNHSSRSLPVLQDYSKTEFTFGAIRHRSQAIIPSYRFQGRGSIMEWGIDLNPANNGNQDMYVLNLQVWRPSPTVATDGCYSLVGSNRFRSVVISGGIARVTPLPIDRIRFQSGDVLGFYVESTRGFNAQSRGVVTLNDFHRHGDRGFETEQVWYANVGDIASTNSECPCPVGLHRGLNTFTNAAPVISVSTGEHGYHF